MTSIPPPPDRFASMRSLYGAETTRRLEAAHVCVVGLGGVGSWAAEALARAGVGTLTLIDGDDVCVSNVNRQVLATDDVIGRPKADVMARRVRSINPYCRALAVPEFFHRTTVDQHLAKAYDWVVDAIDGVTNKMWLIAACRERGLKVIASGAAGAKRDPTLIRIADLGDTFHDPLLAFVRKKLRVRFGFPDRGQPFGIPCVFSPEIAPEGSTACEVDSACETDDGEPAVPTPRNCNSGLGAAGFVTGTFGLMAAGYVVNALTGSPPAKAAAPPPPARLR